MFIYQNKDRDICITFKNNIPVENPEYVIHIDDDQIVINGETVATGNNVVVSDNIVYETAVEINDNVNLYLNGKTISIPNDTEGNGVYRVTEGGHLVINGNGTVNGVGNNDYNIAIWADGGNVTINGGTFTNVGATASVDPAHFDLIYVKNNSVVEINGGYFDCQTPKWTLNLNDKNPGKIIVKGGTFVNFDPSAAETEPGGLTNFVAEGYKVIQEGSLYSVVKI